MIRIDEIYNHIFWPYLKKHVPKTRLFFCDPHGSTTPETLVNFGEDVSELNYIYCHDQEPIYSDVHQLLFQEVVNRNVDLNYYNTGPIKSAIITSELNSESVESVCNQYGWRHYYYFFHGWAALDWYRGYNQTFLITDYHSRHHYHSFISTNRIVGGRRDHRILLMYHLLKQSVKDGLISFPLICPVEQQSVITLSKKLTYRYPDISNILESAGFPWHMPGENNHPMHSCWLSLFEENASSLVHVVTETAYFGRKWHLTEKTFKPICLQMPFVLVSTAGSLEYLRNYGFQTFGTLWDESYDQETDDHRRLEKIACLLKQFDDMTVQQRQQLHQAAWPIVKHNFDHFYNGGFEKILWKEFSAMLSQIKQDLNQ
jgi:hypothetical protein